MFLLMKQRNKTAKRLGNAIIGSNRSINDLPVTTRLKALPGGRRPFQGTFQVNDTSSIVVEEVVELFCSWSMLILPCLFPK